MTRPSFVKLTAAGAESKGKSVFVALGRALVFSAESSGSTIINFGRKDWVEVRETPEEILTLMRGETP